MRRYLIVELPACGWQLTDLWYGYERRFRRAVDAQQAALRRECRRPGRVKTARIDWITVTAAGRRVARVLAAAEEGRRS